VVADLTKMDEVGKPVKCGTIEGFRSLVYGKI